MGLLAIPICCARRSCSLKRTPVDKLMNKISCIVWLSVPDIAKERPIAIEHGTSRRSAFGACKCTRSQSYDRGVFRHWVIPAMRANKCLACIETKSNRLAHVGGRDVTQPHPNLMFHTLYFCCNFDARPTAPFHSAIT